MQSDQLCTAFCGGKKIVRGTKAEVALSSRKFLDSNSMAQILVFDDESKIVELDLRGSVADVKQRFALGGKNLAEVLPESVRGRGRPKLGVIAREVTLLPRHWDWLNEQSGGASVAIRKLVEKARLADQISPRKSREITYKFMGAIGGDLPGFEEASRALFAGDKNRFKLCIREWPADFIEHIDMIAETAF